MKEQNTYCGFISIIGKSNVGKSTLLNHIIKKKISITSNRFQTTHHRIIAIDNSWPYQYIYIDTPGFHIKKNILNKLMNKTIDVCVSKSEIILFVIESTNWSIEDEILKNKICNMKKTVILVMNKIDKLNKKEKLLLNNYLNFFRKKMQFYKIIPICAKKNVNIKLLKNIIKEKLPISKHVFFENVNSTIYSHKFIATEIIRESLINSFNKEIPYFINVYIEKFNISNSGIYSIYALILTENFRQKKIVIGNKGNNLKNINLKIRKKMELLFKSKVNLYLFVKVQSNWINDLEILNKMGYIKNIQEITT